jgi:hypothetical protein
VTFSVPPSLKIYYSKYLTACIIMTTFSCSTEALAVLFRTSSNHPFRESHCHKACF